MKLKEYQQLSEAKRNANRTAYQAKNNNDLDTYFAQKEVANQIQIEMDKAPKVKVRFNIGSRSYYREVMKIGKTYIDRGDKLNRSNGYSCIEEIPAITEKMKEEMIADSYYY
jgi:hypothetical protein